MTLRRSRNFSQRESNFDNVFPLFCLFLGDEGREDPSTTISGHHRPASETPLYGPALNTGLVALRFSGDPGKSVWPSVHVKYF